MKKTVNKDVLNNWIRHTDSQNRVWEESEMWKQRKLEKDLREKSSNVIRVEKRKKSQGPDTKEEFQGGYWNKKLMEIKESDNSKWGHSGYKELYPEEFGEDHPERRQAVKEETRGLRSSWRQPSTLGSRDKGRMSNGSATPSPQRKSSHKKKNKRKHRSPDSENGEDTKKSKNEVLDNPKKHEIKGKSHKKSKKHRKSRSVERSTDDLVESKNEKRNNDTSSRKIDKNALLRQRMVELETSEATKYGPVLPSDIKKKRKKTDHEDEQNDGNSRSPVKKVKHDSNGKDGAREKVIKEKSPPRKKSSKKKKQTRCDQTPEYGSHSDEESHVDVTRGKKNSRKNKEHDIPPDDEDSRVDITRGTNDSRKNKEHVIPSNDEESHVNITRGRKDSRKNKKKKHKKKHTKHNDDHSENGDEGEEDGERDKQPSRTKLRFKENQTKSHHDRESPSMSSSPITRVSSRNASVTREQSRGVTRDPLDDIRDPMLDFPRSDGECSSKNSLDNEEEGNLQNESDRNPQNESDDGDPTHDSAVSPGRKKKSKKERKKSKKKKKKHRKREKGEGPPTVSLEVSNNFGLCDSFMEFDDIGD